MKLYSIIVPVYNEQEIINKAYTRLKNIMDKLNNPYELIFIDDGSSDNTLSELKDIADKDSNAKILVLSRNFGHQIAVTAGLKASKGDAVIVIDADMQDPPELIPEMIKKWKEGFEVVYGKRNQRLGETSFKKITAKVYYRFLKFISDEKIPEDVGDFRLLDRKVVDIINNMGEHNRYLRGLSTWSGFRQCPIDYTREERTDGESKYTFKKMTRLATDGVLSMSNKILKMIFVIGLILTFIGFITFSCNMLKIIIGDSTTIIISGMAFFTGLILTAMGILGAYVGRIYDEVKNRPLYIVSDMINFKE